MDKNTLIDIVSSKLAKYKHTRSAMSYVITSLRANKEVVECWKQLTNFLDNDTPDNQRLYCIMNNIESINDLPVCVECGAPVRFNSYSKGFSRFCGNRCASSNKDTQQKSRDTSIRKHGSVENAKRLRLEKTKKTNLERYGVEWNIASDNNRSKARETYIRKYGYTNPFKDKELVRNSMLKKYNVTHNSRLASTIKKRSKTWMSKYGTDKLYEIQLLVGKNGISAVSQQLFNSLYNMLSEDDKNNCYFAELNKEFGKQGKSQYFFFDFTLTNKKKIIEFNGDYWHCNPLLYEDSFLHPIIGLTASELWVRDRSKIETITKMGFDVLVIWENDYRSSPNNVIQQCIAFLNN